MNIIKSTIFFLVLVLYSCTNSNHSIDMAAELSKSIKKKYAPDKRVDIFDIQFSSSGNSILLEGKSTSQEAVNALLADFEKNEIPFENKLRILPDVIIGDSSYAVGRNSVINIRSKPKHSSELGTQGLLGMNLRVLDKEGDFYQVQTPDQYISWVDKGGITRMTKSDFDTWKNSKKVIYLKNFGYVYQEKNDNSKIVSDISLGGILKYLDEDEHFYQVSYPDNRIGYLSKDEALPYQTWLNSIEANSKNIESVAKSMQGFPYLWGGTSAKGIDCSGYTKMVYLMNGFVIPRDASQQVHAGKIVDPELTFKGLEKGDLLFFGKKGQKGKKDKVTHVGIWLGNGKGEFIHASGNVHISSILEDHTNYDAFNKNRYLGSRRYLGQKDKLIIDLKTRLKL